MCFAKRAQAVISSLKSTAWERAFVAGVVAQVDSGRDATARQCVVFDRICGRVESEHNHSQIGTQHPENGTKGTERLARVRESEQCSVPIPVPFRPFDVPISVPNESRMKTK